MNTRNTLPASITSRFFRTEDGYSQLKARWAKLMADKVGLSASDHLLYAVLTGRDWRKGFVPVTNQVKLDNGAREWNARDGALATIHSKYCGARAFAPFADLLSEDAKATILALLPSDKTFYSAAYVLPAEAAS